MSRLRDCKLWKECKSKSCVKELKAIYGKNWRNGSIIWSKEVCYKLHELEKRGLIKSPTTNKDYQNLAKKSSLNNNKRCIESFKKDKGLTKS